jgi:hypothetical protein
VLVPLALYSCSLLVCDTASTLHRVQRELQISAKDVSGLSEESRI